MKRSRGSIAGRLALALLAGFLVHLLLFPAGSDESDSRACHSVIGYEVPCGNQSYAAGAVTTLLVAGLLLKGTARRPDQEREHGEMTVGTHT
jgi:hypothetical protein